MQPLGLLFFGHGASTAVLAGPALWLRVLCLLGVSAICGGSAGAAEAFEDEFDAGELEPGFWCACQINIAKAPVMFVPDPDDGTDYFAEVTVDEASLGGNLCRSASPDYECGVPITMPEGSKEPQLLVSEPGMHALLGPSFLRARTLAGAVAIMDRNGFCTKGVMKRVEAAGEEGDCIQRQELRLRKHLWHDAEETHTYRLRFRLRGAIRGEVLSARWITAQWKQEPVSDSYKNEFGAAWGPSPFLAQRFDAGILHVTVQDEHCRCLVASAPLWDGSILPSRNGVPQHCLSTRPDESEGTACTPDLKVQYGNEPVLSSPLNHWVELSYRVQPGRLNPGAVEVHEGARFIVRVTGKIGYETPAGMRSLTKFKIGHYRDYMPHTNQMDIDRVSIEPD